MADQATVRNVGGNGASSRPAEAFQHSMADFAHDVLTLGELQTQLFLMDAKATGRGILLPTLLAGAGLVLFLGAVPVLLFGIAYILVDQAGFSEWSAFLLTFLAAVVVTAGLLLAAWALYRRSTWPLRRSQDEFTRNVRWVLDVLKRKRSPAGRRT